MFREPIPDKSGIGSLLLSRLWISPNGPRTLFTLLLQFQIGHSRARFNCRKEDVFMAANVQHSTDGSSLAEVVDRILDRGCVIDVFARVTLVGIELLAIEARVVIASVDTWLKYAEAVGLTTTFDQMSAIP